MNNSTCYLGKKYTVIFNGSPELRPMVDSDSEALPGVSEQRNGDPGGRGGERHFKASTARRAQFALQCPVFTYLMQQNKAADDCQVFSGKHAFIVTPRAELD